MSFFITIKLKQLKKLGYLLGFGIMIVTLIVISNNLDSAVFSSTEKPSALMKGDENNRAVSLTFNLTWGDQMLEPILDQLETESVSATFFLLGEWAEHHPHLVDLIVDRGHEIGMLGYRYKSYLKQTINDVQNDLYRAKDTFTKLGYPDLTLIRTPSGHFDQDILSTAVNQGYQVIDWRVDADDWKTPGVNQIVEQVITNTSNGDIILMHASDSATQTKEALETIIPHLKEKGYSFVTISELISQAQIDTNSIE
ncbi:MAG TPA: polysaccharide deacetylase family sporulation protein PdaB [Bacilli bacterium]|nr:polysaccharide deacetylase family sporulation protein PdaB [Bacilli bacterium]